MSLRLLESLHQPEVHNGLFSVLGPSPIIAAISQEGLCSTVLSPKRVSDVISRRLKAIEFQEKHLLWSLGRRCCKSS